MIAEPIEVVPAVKASKRPANETPTEENNTKKRKIEFRKVLVPTHR